MGVGADAIEEPISSAKREAARNRRVEEEFLRAKVNGDRYGECWLAAKLTVWNHMLLIF